MPIRVYWFYCHFKLLEKVIFWRFFSLCLQQFNQLRQAQPHNLYKQMPQLKFGPGGGRGANFSKPFIPNQPGQVNQRQQMNLPQFGQVGRLAGNPSVTIQVSLMKNGSNLANLNFSLNYIKPNYFKKQGFSSSLLFTWNIVPKWPWSTLQASFIHLGTI